MIKELIIQWEENKKELEEWFKSTPQSEYYNYSDIVKAVFSTAIKGYDSNNITVVSTPLPYTGESLFIIRTDYDQDETVGDYLMVNVIYGSCSCCDTLLGINDGQESLPNEEQVKQYMTLCLHIVQNAKRVGDFLPHWHCRLL